MSRQKFLQLRSIPLEKYASILIGVIGHIFFGIAFSTGPPGVRPSKAALLIDRGARNIARGHLLLVQDGTLGASKGLSGHGIVWPSPSDFSSCITAIKFLVGQKQVIGAEAYLACSTLSS